MYTFEVAFNDGTVGEANAKSQQPPYKVGEMAYYVKTGKSPKGGDKLKISKEPTPPWRIPAVPTANKPQQGQANDPGDVL